MTDSLSHLPVNPLPNVPRHVYGPDHFVKADPNKGRPYNQTERACPCGVCGLVIGAVGDGLCRTDEQRINAGRANVIWPFGKAPPITGGSASS